MHACLSYLREADRVYSALEILCELEGLGSIRFADHLPGDLTVPAFGLALPAPSRPQS